MALAGPMPLYLSKSLMDSFSQCVEVVVAVAEHLFHQIDCCLVCVARTDQDGQQFRVGQPFGSQSLQTFAWAVFLRPVVDVQFAVAHL